VSSPIRAIYDEARNAAIAKTERDALDLSRPLIRFRGTPEEMSEKRGQIMGVLTIAAARLAKLEAGRPTG
jgi:hypothetical protein